MTKKRDRLEIIKDILETIRDKGEKVRPTHIMYKANLSHQMLTEYTDELLTKKLILEDKDKKGRPIVISESDVLDSNGKPTGRVKRFKHDPFFTVDLNKLFLADITACPSNVGPMLIDMAQKVVELKKGAFKSERRRTEYNWWWIVMALLLIPGILTVVFMLFGGPWSGQRCQGDQR